MSKRIVCAVMAIVMVLSLAACGKSETPAPAISTTINGSAVENGAVIIDNVPMVKGDVVGSTAEYLTLTEVENMGYTVVYKNDELVISKVQNIDGNINDDVNVEGPNASTDVIGGNNGVTTDDPVDSETPNGTTTEDVTGEAKDPVSDDKNETTETNPTDKDNSTGNDVTVPDETTTPENKPTEPVVKPEDKPTETKPNETHTHKYTSKVVAPTCEKEGYTTHTCSCGESYTDSKTKATGHSYTEKVVAPTTSEKGYTLHTCSKCGNSYKDNYKDKLPASTGNDNYVNDGGQADSETAVVGLVAGKFADTQTAKENRPTPNPSANKATAVSDLTGLMHEYGMFRFFDHGIAQNIEDEGKIAKFVTDSNGRVGINVFGWRKSYDSDATTNAGLNLVLEAFYYMTGDRQVAKALWDWVDAMEINGRANSDNYGFHDVVWNDSQKIIEMNGIQIEYVPGSNGNTFYFN